MNAAIQQPYPRNESRPLDELSTTHKISRNTAFATEIPRGLESLAGLVLSLRGIRAVELDPVPELQEYAGAPFIWTAPGKSVVNGNAVAEIAAARIRWGQLRIRFNVHAIELESPVRFARFVAQQIAGMLNRLALQSQSKMLRQRLARLTHRLQTRKVVQRASGILARMHGIPQSEAIRLLIRHSRERASSLYSIAEGIILLECRLSLPDRGFSPDLITMPSVVRSLGPPILAAPSE
jgi:ANTAR domain